MTGNYRLYKNGIFCIIAGTMKVFVAILILFVCSSDGFSQYWPAGYVYVGNVDCHSKEQYLDSTKKAYDNAWENRDVHNSLHIIDISLDVTGFPFFDEITARLYWDSTFTLYYTGYQIQADGKSCVLDTIFPPADQSIDSLFHQLVEAGLFTLPYISTEDLRKSWNSICIGKHGETLENNQFRVSDGENYILTYKVNNCYGQHVFKNPDGYASFYIDHPIFKRQAAIVDAIMKPYYFQKNKLRN
jgi:hypothetical protein